MSETATWRSAVTDQVRVVAGDWVDEAAAEWERFAAEPGVQVTVHGGYDAGKTSLIKRLLVEDGTPLPDGLAVGAKPTSDAVQRIASDGIVWVDTPGTAAGNVDHDSLAESALTCADAVLVVLSPQMLSGDQDVLRSVLDGSRYNPEATRPLFPVGSLVIAVAQMDRAGVSPWDDLDGYRRLLDRKGAELRAALGPAADVVAGHVHFVAADPDQAGLDEHPTREDYAGNEAWDGIAGLRADLRALLERRAQLRVAAGVRYWSWVADRTRDKAADERGLLDKVLDEGARHDKVVRLYLDELDAIDHAARSRLREKIYDELLSGVVPPDGRDAQRAVIEDTLDDAIDAWLAEWSGKLDELARRASTEQRVRAQRPGSAALREHLDDLFTAERPPQAPSRPAVDQLLQRLDEHVKTVARAGFHALHGKSVEEARAELAGLQMRTGEATGATLLSGTEHADHVSKSLARLAAFETVLPVVVELTTVVVDDVLDKRAEQRRAELRGELRRQADAIAEEIVAGGRGAQTWAHAVDGLRAALTSSGVPADVLARAEERRADLTRAVDGLTDLLGWADAARA